MSDEHRYRLAYKLEAPDGGLSKAEAIALQKEGWGACDAMFAASIIYPADGSLSVLFVSKDGRTGEQLDDLEWFKIWSMLSSRLARSESLSEAKRELCGLVFEILTDAVQRARGVS